MNSLPVFAVLVQLLPLAWPFYVLKSAPVGLEAALSLTQLHLPTVSPYPETNRNVTISLTFKHYCKSVVSNSKKKVVYAIFLQRKRTVWVYWINDIWSFYTDYFY